MCCVSKGNSLYSVCSGKLEFWFVEFGVVATLASLLFSLSLSHYYGDTKNCETITEMQCNECLQLHPNQVANMTQLTRKLLLHFYMRYIVVAEKDDDMMVE